MENSCGKVEKCRALWYTKTQPRPNRTERVLNDRAKRGRADGCPNRRPKTKPPEMVSARTASAPKTQPSRPKTRPSENRHRRQPPDKKVFLSCEDYLTPLVRVSGGLSPEHALYFQISNPIALQFKIFRPRTQFSFDFLRIASVFSYWLFKRQIQSVYRV